MASLPQRLASSLEASQAAFAKRLAAGKQPLAPAFVRHAAGGALRFLDYTDTSALVAVNGAYLVVVALLYAWMRSRDAGFTLRGAMVAYNAVCVALAAYVVYGVVDYKWRHPGSFACNRLDSSTDGLRLSHFLWVYYAQKFLEFGDTLFFVLRRSFRQLTVLHLYHHVSITLVTAAFLRYDVNGDTYLPALCNSAVHVLMYSHYLLAAFGVDTFWKVHLTSLQLVQFLVVMAQSLVSLAKGTACGFPLWLKLVMVAYQLSMLVLFAAFFVDSYLKTQKARRAKGKRKAQ